MSGKLVRCVSVLMGVLAAFDSGACMARSKKDKPLKVKKVVIKEKIVPVVVSVREDRTPPVVGLLKYFSELEPSFGGIVRSALVLHLATEVVMVGKGIFDYLEVDGEKSRVRNALGKVIDVKNLGTANNFLDEVGFHTVYIYADKYSGGQLRRDFAFSVLRKVSDIAMSDSKKLEVEIKLEDGKAKNKKSESQKILYNALLDLCKVLFSSDSVEGSEKIIGCFLEACLDAGCVKLDKEGKICKGDGYPLSWRTLTPFRYWGSNGDYDYAGVINGAIKKRLNADTKGKVKIGSREIVVS